MNYSSDVAIVTSQNYFSSGILIHTLYVEVSFPSLFFAKVITIILIRRQSG